MTPLRQSSAMRLVAHTLCALAIGALSACGTAAMHPAGRIPSSTMPTGVCVQARAKVACLQREVSDDAAWLRAHDIRLASWGPSPSGDQLVITVVKPNPRILNLLRQRYGVRHVELRSVDALPRAV